MRKTFWRNLHFVTFSFYLLTYLLTKIEFKTGYGYPANCNRVLDSYNG